MKYEWRKKEKGLYLPKTEPEIVIIPDQKFLMISGTGNPNDIEFSEKVEALYSLSYIIRMMPKNNYQPKGYFEYTVYPLEGVWKLKEQKILNGAINKNDLIYTIMIRQPDFVNEEVVQKALEMNINKKKNSNKLIGNIKFKTTKSNLSVQMMHIGSYDNEFVSFLKMKSFIEKNNLKRIDNEHREIYISDPRKTASDKLKTVLRYTVIQNNN